MQTETLKFISDAMEAAGIPYEFGEFSSPIASLDYYFIGEYQEIEPMNEDGQEESQFILTGTGRCKFLDLEKAKKKIKKMFPTIGGKTAVFEDGSATAVFYGNAMPVPTGDGALKRIQINLTVKEWKVKE